VREEVRKTLLEGLVPKPTINPESRGSPVAQRDFGDRAKGGEPRHNILQIASYCTPDTVQFGAAKAWIHHYFF
jgi:hypothetical protein